MKRFIDIHIPVTACNLECHYCYVAHGNLRNSKSSVFKYSPKHIGEALSKERLGGACHINMCGLGETLIPMEIIPITEEILKQGHYVMIVTNGLLTNRLVQFCDFSDEYKKRLGFKLSFHYLELKKKNLLKVFFENIEMLKKAKISFTVELTPSDELEPYIDDLKNICMEKLGALCHITIPRNIRESGINLLSNHSMTEFSKIWGQFDSPMFDFKLGVWEEKRCEFCYAGAWTGLLNVGTGEFRACYNSDLVQNIFEDLNSPIEFVAIGKCKIPHCYNSHSLLGLGNIPQIRGHLYSEQRNRISKIDGSEWLQPEMKEFLSHRLEEYNEQFESLDKIKNSVAKNKIIVKDKIIKVKRKLKKRYE